jgi:cyclic beta-1,2-glucan synthetase
VRHGHGFTECEHAAGDLQVHARVFVTHDRPVRVDMIEVANAGTEPRRISLFAYRELVLGDTSASSGRLTTAWSEPDQQTLLARNLAAGPFAGHVTFAAVAASAGQVQHGCSRRGFLGPQGHVANPAALHRPALGDPDPAPAANLVGDACFAHQVSLTLAPGERASACFVLGQQPDADQARALATALATPSACDQAWHDTRASWRRGLDRLQVTTPSPALDLMVNGWLAYQTLACRMLGRTALYQSGGAFGFRDQLQDSLALLPLWPERTRAQILLHAGHQFLEGDVLHWWHPPGDGGIRTRFADDLLWLPLLTAQYVDATGDAAILAEPAPYLRARHLEPGEDEAFVTPTLAGERGDLYDHCCRALDRSLATGAHGLPLFGTGDWNDGMNRVGRLGRGESVWMGFFLVSAIDAFAPFCDQRGDTERAAHYRAHRDRLATALDDGGWDGQWYLRGYYDDGTPLGSHMGDECRIDALVQAWSVLSGVASPARREQVLDMVDHHLIAEDQGLIRLLTPPFVDTPHDPGYIKGYVAGVRENGGQYTHAALWVVQAMAAAGRRHRAAALLDLLNPVLHAVTDADVARYQVEPYVVAADVYGAEPHIGRGGWTWYTGSSGWMLRVALESVLGLTTPGGDTLQLAPCVPDTWPGFSLSWCEPVADTTYDLVVTNPHGCAAAVVAITLDGEPHEPVDGVCRLPLARDGGRHQVQVELGHATNPEDDHR